MSDNEKRANPHQTKSHQPKSHQPMGRSMLLIAWGLVFVGLVAFFSGWENKQINPNQNLVGNVESGIREVVLESNRYHHYVATGGINGTSVVFLVDTGATDVSVPEGLAKKLGLRRGAQGYAQTANGVVAIYSTTIKQLTLGTLEFNNVPASINPGMDGNEVLLGMSALRHVEMIQKDNKLTLRQVVE